MSEETRIARGGYCSWWDSIDKASLAPIVPGHAYLVCPSCGKPLAFVDEEKDWMESIQPRYLPFIKWLRGRQPCFASQDEALSAFKEQS